jgi:hypothetical protein
LDEGKRTLSVKKMLIRNKNQDKKNNFLLTPFNVITLYKEAEPSNKSPMIRFEKNLKIKKKTQEKKKLKNL